LPCSSSRTTLKLPFFNCSMGVGCQPVKSPTTAACFAPVSAGSEKVTLHTGRLLRYCFLIIAILPYSRGLSDCALTSLENLVPTSLSHHNRIIAAEGIGHVLIRLPVVVPLTAIHQIAELIFLASFKFKFDGETTIPERFHGCGLFVPVVEITNEMNGLGFDGCRKVESHLAHRAALQKAFFQHG